MAIGIPNPSVVDLLQDLNNTSAIASLHIYFKTGRHEISCCGLISRQTPPFQHCLHRRNFDSDLDYLLNFRCKHSQLPDAPCHVKMACNQWLETWDVAIIYTRGTRICVTVQWMSVDCMTLSPAKLNIIWTAAVNSRVMTGESQTQSWSITSW